MEHTLGGGTEVPVRAPGVHLPLLPLSVPLGPWDIQHRDPELGQAVAGGSGMGSAPCGWWRPASSRSGLLLGVMLGLTSSCLWGSAASWDVRDISLEPSLTLQ